MSPKPRVAIYTTPTCKYCKAAKDLFTKHNIPYSEYNIAIDGTKRIEMIQKTGQLGVPVIEVDDNVVVGFDEGRIEELLGVIV